MAVAVAVSTIDEQLTRSSRVAGLFLLSHLLVLLLLLMLLLFILLAHKYDLVVYARLFADEIDE